VAEKILFEEREQEIRAYIDNKISRGKSRRLHLVFQGTGEHNMFSYQIFKLVEDCLFKKKYSTHYKLEKEAAEFIINKQFAT